jgi:hypothetical protein
MSGLSTIEMNYVARHALCHYVPFSYYARSEKIFAARGGVAALCVCSAFVMRTRNIWWLVTAGHVLTEIENEIAKGNELVDFRLWGGWGLEATDKYRTSFDFFRARKFRIDQDGLDYGIIHLSDYYVSHLEANKVLPIDENSFEKDWPTEFDGYAMIGTPASTVFLERVGEKATRLTQTTCIIQLEQEPTPPQELIQPTKRFYARILPPADSSEWLAIGGDIAGMSGGPLLGVRRAKNGLKYWVIGVQSGWLESKRVIAACFFQDFAKYVGGAIDRIGIEHFK